MNRTEDKAEGPWGQLSQSGALPITPAVSDVQETQYKEPLPSQHALCGCPKV